jgi:hypothetical protein
MATQSAEAGAQMSLEIMTWVFVIAVLAAVIWGFWIGTGDE